MTGPVDYIIIGFSGNKFDGSILGEITDASNKGIIRVLDLVFILKDKSGAIIEGEFEDQSTELKKSFGNLKIIDDMPLLTKDDIAKIGEQMKNNTSAAMLVIEHLWAKNIKRAIKDAGGYLIADGRIREEKVERALKDLEAVEA